MISKLALNRWSVTVCFLVMSWFAVLAPARGSFSFEGDLATRLQDIKADPVPSLAQGDDINTQVQLQEFVGNLHLRHRAPDRYSVYLETWLTWGHELEVNEVYVDFPTLVEATTFRVGKFEVDYGNQHLRRTDFGQAQDNPLIGNSFLDPVGVQMGVQGNGQVSAIEWSASITNGNDTNVAGPNNGPGLTAKIKTSLTGRLSVSGSLYRRDSSVDSSTLAHPSNLFSESTISGEIYRLPNNSVQASLGDGGDVTAWQFGGRYTHTVGYLEGWYGQFQDTVNTSSPGLDQEVDYYGSEVRIDLTPSYYAASRYERLVDRTGVVSGEDVNRLQVGLGYRWDQATLVKFEWMNQSAENYPAGDPEAAINVTPQDVNSLSLELTMHL